MVVAHGRLFILSTIAITLDTELSSVCAGGLPCVDHRDIDQKTFHRM